VAASCGAPPMKRVRVEEAPLSPSPAVEWMSGSGSGGAGSLPLARASSLQPSQPQDSQAEYLYESDGDDGDDTFLTGLLSEMDAQVHEVRCCRHGSHPLGRASVPAPPSCPYPPSADKQLLPRMPCWPLRGRCETHARCPRGKSAVHAPGHPPRDRPLPPSHPNPALSVGRNSDVGLLWL
jgi:hypothetical protein